MESRRITVSLLQINMNNIMIMTTYGMDERFTLINLKILQCSPTVQPPSTEKHRGCVRPMKLWFLLTIQK